MVQRNLLKWSRG